MVEVHLRHCKLFSGAISIWNISLRNIACSKMTSPEREVRCYDSAIQVKRTKEYGECKIKHTKRRRYLAVFVTGEPIADRNCAHPEIAARLQT